MKRRLGPAWLESAPDGTFVRRRGRLRPGFLDEPGAIVAKDRIIRDVERELAERAETAERETNAPPTFRVIAHAYLDWLEHVCAAKPKTLLEHRYLLIEPGTPHRRGRGEHRGLIMDALGDRPADEIPTREINALLAENAAGGVAPRTVNKTRQLVCAIFSHACRESTFGLARNPATAADRRPEPERARLDFYSTEEVEALARAVAAGQHRDQRRPAVNDAVAEARATEDRQDAEIVRIAAYTGLRRGELVALRWRDVDFPRHKIVVQRAIGATSRPHRRSPDALATSRFPTRPPARSTASRSAATSRVRTISSSSTASAADSTRQRFAAASSAPATPPACARFGSTTSAIHTYDSLLVAGGVDLSVKAAMGHSRITTTERYLHARSAGKMAERFTKALSATAPAPVVATQSAA